MEKYKEKKDYYDGDLGLITKWNKFCYNVYFDFQDQCFCYDEELEKFVKCEEEYIILKEDVTFTLWFISNEEDGTIDEILGITTDFYEGC